MPLCLAESDVRAVLTIPDLIAAMENVLVSFSAGRALQPVRPVIEMGEMAFFATMPAYLPDPGVLGAKLVAVIAANERRGLATHQATIQLLDPDTGLLTALMDGRWITEMRTAAVSAVSVRHMAREDASVLAIVGSGVQARSHVAALTHVRQFRDIRAWSPTAAHLHRFAAESDVPIRACDSAAEAVRGADVVVLATASVTPAIENGWVSPGAHVVSVGACRPTHREIDPALMARARLVVDSKASAFAESGDVVLGIRDGLFAREHVLAELGEVVAGRLPGRTSDTEVTVFKSLGLAVEDLAAAHLAWVRARELGKGVTIDLSA